MTHSLIFCFLVLNLINLLFYTSFCCKWPERSHVFVRWPVGQKQLGHAGIDNNFSLQHCSK